MVATRGRNRLTWPRTAYGTTVPGTSSRGLAERPASTPPASASGKLRPVATNAVDAFGNASDATAVAVW